MSNMHQLRAEIMRVARFVRASHAEVGAATDETAVFERTQIILADLGFFLEDEYVRRIVSYIFV
jgi:hypothetical protein